MQPPHRQARRMHPHCLKEVRQGGLSTSLFGDRKDAASSRSDKEGATSSLGDEEVASNLLLR